MFKFYVDVFPLAPKVFQVLKKVWHKNFNASADLGVVN